MSDVLKKIGKLKGRGLTELRVRGAQALAARAERAGLSALARTPTDATFFRLLDSSRWGRELKSAEAWLEHFRRRRAPRFFAGFDEEEATRTALCTRFRVEEALVTERAERILEGRFDLLGLRDLSFGSPVDWHLEPLTRVRAPLTHWSRIDFLDPKVSGDKKFIWELNRQQFFQTLGRAYWRTCDERFAEGFVHYAEEWMDANPPKLGVNWASSLEVAFRSISWLWALHFFKRSTRLTPEFFLRLSKFLYLHARHLETYLSTYFSPNTHLTGEALGLFYLGTLLPEMRDAHRWRETGRRILLAELDRHVRADGVYFEQATYYHRYTTDFYMHFALLARENVEGLGADGEGLGAESEGLDANGEGPGANSEGLNGRLASKLSALLDHLMYLTRPDGTTPFVGDDDGGRLSLLDERRTNDFRAALSNGAALFGRADYKHVAGEVAEETLWLQGTAGLAAFDALDASEPAETSRAFHEGGYYLMRDGWASDSNYMLLDCGPHGASEIGSGHGHADALSFELAARGRTLLVDPGTFTYTGSPAWRDRFRSSTSHNTLALDGVSSSVPGESAFRWAHVARARTKTWTTGERFDFFEGEHDGYMRLRPAPACVTRGVLFLKGDYWVMRDRVETEGAHASELRFQFAADAAPSVEETDAGKAEETDESKALGGREFVREYQAGASGLDVFTFASGGGWRAEEGWVSHAYGARSAAPAYVFAAQTHGAAEFVTILLPRRAAEFSVTRAREIEAVGGRAFEVCAVESTNVESTNVESASVEDVSVEDACDFVLLGDGARYVQTARLSTDFAWAWVRCAAGGEPDELVLIDGQSFRVGGIELVRAERRVGWLVARRTDEGWSVRAEAGVRVAVAAEEGALKGGEEFYVWD
ncbi:MAG: hypothetical protein QOC99_1169 [Acidobacteriota bacterium]|jgi:hypothetical protein|nr:hypothetical protein [Acidobacteriota bacterium]